jgi:hypothetical protein
MEYDKLILNSHNKIKTAWNVINKKSGRKNNSNNIQALDMDGKKIIDQQSIAETFNEYFVTIAEHIRKEIRYIHMHVNNNDVDNHTQCINHAFDNPFPNIENKYSTIKQIEQIINSLKTKNSFGYDGISTKILKLSAPFISSPINYICNRMLSQGIFQDILKYATVIPLHKKGDRRNMSKHRPVSLSASFSKIFETVMLRRISTHFSKHNILSSEQYGFITGFRTDDAIYKLTTEILNSMNIKLAVGGIFCDLEKAFDCVDHGILLSKLKFYGINAKHLALYQSYLGNIYSRMLIYNESDNKV